jgi:enoyl reductase-like protein
LSTTSGLSKEDVLKAADRQLAELKKLKEGLISALPDWHDDLKVMESKSLEIRKEISRLREEIMLLETKRQEILDGMAVREKEMEIAEKGMEDLFEDIVAEIVDIREKIGESTYERVLPRSIKTPHSTKYSKRDMEESDCASESDFREVFARQEIEGGKKCSLCGGQMNLYLKDKMWKCFVCAYEEAEEMEVNDVQEKIENPLESAPAQAHNPADAPPPTFSIPPEFTHVQRRPAVSTKACPVCRKKMDWQEMEKSWRCPSCEYQRMEF